jgi:hypothetical protein
LALVLAIALTAAYAGRWSQWLGVWSETQQHLGTAFILAIPAAAGVGAWVGAGNKRGGLEELQRGASRRPITIALREYVEPAVWTGWGYIAGSLPAGVATALTATSDRPRLLPACAQLLCVAGATATGQLVGSRLPWFLGAPVCAAVAYAGLGFVSFNAESLLVALTPIDERWMTFHATLWWVLLLQAAFWAFMFLQAVVRRAGHTTAAFGVLVAAGLVVAPLLSVTPKTRSVPVAGVQMSCVDQANTAVCVPMAKRLLAPELMRAAVQAAQLLQGLLPTRAAYVDDEARGVSIAADRSIEQVVSEQASAGRSPVYFSRAGDLSAYTHLDRNQFHYSLVAFAVPVSTVGVARENASASSRGLPVATPSDVLQRWYLRQLGVPIDGTGGPGAPYLEEQHLDYRAHPQAVERFERLTAAERADWFFEHASVIREGALTWSDLEQSGR